MELFDRKKLRQDSKLRKELNKIKSKAQFTYIKEKDKKKLEALNNSVDNLLEVIDTDCEADDKEILDSFKSVMNQCDLLQKRGKKSVKVQKGFAKASKIGLKAFTIAFALGSIGGVIGFIIWAFIHWCWQALSLGLASIELGLIDVAMLGLLATAVDTLENYEGGIEDHDPSLKSEDFAYVAKLAKELENQQNPGLLPKT